MTAEEGAAIEAIRGTINSYTIAGDSRNAALFGTLWADDAVLEFAGFPPVPGFRSEGAEEIRSRTAIWSPDPAKDPSFAKTRFIRHNLTTSLIELTGPDSARARTYFIVFTEIGQDHMGSYNDELVRRGERWLFVHRRIVLDWRAENSLFPPLN
jgi:hypothetical protein